MNKETLYLIDRYYQIQKHRMAMGSQIRALKKTKKKTTLLLGYQYKLEDIEKDIKKNLQKDVQTHVMWDWLNSVKGIGPIIAAALVSTIDIKIAKHASSLWKYAGLDVASDGRGRSKQKAQTEAATSALLNWEKIKNEF